MNMKTKSHSNQAKTLGILQWRKVLDEQTDTDILGPSF